MSKLKLEDIYFDNMSSTNIFQPTYIRNTMAHHGRKNPGKKNRKRMRMARAKAEGIDTSALQESKNLGYIERKWGELEKAESGDGCGDSAASRERQDTAGQEAQQNSQGSGCGVHIKEEHIKEEVMKEEEVIKEGIEEKGRN